MGDRTKLLGPSVFFTLTEHLVKRGGKFSFYGKISRNSPVTSLSSFTGIPLQPHSGAAEQIWLSPAGGTIKLS